MNPKWGACRTERGQLVGGFFDGRCARHRYRKGGQPQNGGGSRDWDEKEAVLSEALWDWLMN